MDKKIKGIKKNSGRVFLSVSIIGFVLGFVSHLTDICADNLPLTLVLPSIVLMIATIVIGIHSKWNVQKISYIEMWLVLFILLGFWISAFTFVSFGCGAGLIIRSSCIASSGYWCSNLVYSHITGNIAITVGQKTGKTWTSWAIMYAPQGTFLSVNVTTQAPNLPFMLQSGSLASGQTISVTLPVNDSMHVVGASTAGFVWVCYSNATGAAITTGIGFCVASSGSISYAQIATLTVQAT